MLKILIIDIYICFEITDLRLQMRLLEANELSAKLYQPNRQKPLPSEAHVIIEILPC